jgi:hypothetical protein
LRLDARLLGRHSRSSLRRQDEALRLARAERLGLRDGDGRRGGGEQCGGERREQAVDDDMGMTSEIDG